MLGHLPAPLLMLVGWLIGLASVPLIGRRRMVIRRNLAACFPQESALWRWAVRCGHYAMLGRFVLDHTLLLAASPARLRRLVRVRGAEHLTALDQRPTILLAPHFLGLEHGGVRLAMDHDLLAMYNPQKSKFSETLIHRARTRLGKYLQLLSNRERVMARTVAALRTGGWIYYLNDMDQRNKGRNLFIPFLGVKHTATLSALPRLARLTNAAIVPCVTLMRPWGGYTIEIGAPWTDFPSGDDERDLRRYNDFVGTLAQAHPTQYYWPHRRFKTRPAGETDLYA